MHVVGTVDCFTLANGNQNLFYKFIEINFIELSEMNFLKKIEFFVQNEQTERKCKFNYDSDGVPKRFKLLAKIVDFIFKI